MNRGYNPCSYLPRRLQIVASLTIFLILCILFLGTSDTDDIIEPYVKQVPFAAQIQSGAHQVVENLPLPKTLPYVKAPQWLNPFRAPAHAAPQVQANSSSGDARWYNDFKWRNPFSSSVTLDDDWIVLPPPKERPPVYTYFDSAGRRKDAKSKEAEQELLMTWRRAWWAQGFKPVILGKPEAMNNPLYRAVQGLELEAELDTELMRWLAWGNMGGGVLCNWLALPMAPHDDPLLSFLRRGEYPTLTRYEGLDNGLFVGNRDDVDTAIKTAIASSELKGVKSIMEAVPSETIMVDPEHDGIAFYSTDNIMSKYGSIREKLENSDTIGDGLAMLPPLINSHLHTTWQNTFTSGIAVLKPLPEHTTSLITPAIELARNLSECSYTPIASSCPPNRPRCKPCVPYQPMVISVPPLFRNTSTLFTIGTVPHPYTIASLTHLRSELDLRFVRRETTRDPWIIAATKELLGLGLSSYARLVHVKDAVASDYGSARSIWMTAEHNDHGGATDLDWSLGFKLPRGHPMWDGHSETPVPGPERRPPPPKQEFGDLPAPSDEDLVKESMLFVQAKAIVNAFTSSSARGKKAAGERMKMRKIVEAWNMADTEAWKFVRAWNARARVERERWEEEEEEFLGKGKWERWRDYVS